MRKRKKIKISYSESESCCSIRFNPKMSTSHCVYVCFSSHTFSTDRRNLFSTSTVTPEIITYQSSSNENMNMKPVKLFSVEKNSSEKTKNNLIVARSNKTFKIEISPITQTRQNLSYFHVVDGSHSMESEHETDRNDEDRDDEDQDDGIVISDEDDDFDGDDVAAEMNNSWENKNENYDNNDELSDEEYLNEPTVTKSTTTTRKPSKQRLKIPSRNVNRRMYTTTSEKPKQQHQSANPLSFMNFINFLKKIQNSFATRTAKTIGDKILILKRFRDSLIEIINRQIESLWKIRTPNRRAELKAEHKKKRVHNIQKRFIGSGDEGGGGWVETGHGSGMAFPSAESALLSISFLTFAVFLIKLVLVMAKM